MAKMLANRYLFTLTTLALAFPLLLAFKSHYIIALLILPLHFYFSSQLLHVWFWGLLLLLHPGFHSWQSVNVSDVSVCAANLQGPLRHLVVEMWNNNPEYFPAACVTHFCCELTWVWSWSTNKPAGTDAWPLSEWRTHSHTHFFTCFDKARSDSDQTAENMPEAVRRQTRARTWIIYETGRKINKNNFIVIRYLNWACFSTILTLYVFIYMIYFALFSVFDSKVSSFIVILRSSPTFASYFFIFVVISFT